MPEQTKTQTVQEQTVDEGAVHKHSQKQAQAQQIKVLYCQLGSQHGSKEITLDAGTTLGQLLAQERVSPELEVRVNKKDVPRETVLEDGVVVVVVPQRISGGA